MRRREFIAFVGAAAAWPLAARAQQPAMPVIGYLSSKGEAAEAGIIAAIRLGLAERGFAEGKNIAIVFRYSNGDYARLPELAADLMGKKVGVIVASGLPASLAAKAATSTIPIVFRLAIDPVVFGLAESFNHPGGNITGVTMLFDPLTPKKLQLLRELIPNAASVGLLVDPKNQNVTSHKDNAERAAKTLGMQLVVLTAASVSEIESAFAAAWNAGVRALLVGDDPLFDVLNVQIVKAAAQYGIATMYYVRDFVTVGGLMSYGPSFVEMSKQVGLYLGRILEGAKPADLPVQQPTKFELVINLKTAKALGLTIPQSLLAAADEVIE